MIKHFRDRYGNVCTLTFEEGRYFLQKEVYFTRASDKFFDFDGGPFIGYGSPLISLYSDLEGVHLYQVIQRVEFVSKGRYELITKPNKAVTRRYLTAWQKQLKDRIKEYSSAVDHPYAVFRAADMVKSIKNTLKLVRKQKQGLRKAIPSKLDALRVYSTLSEPLTGFVINNPSLYV